MKRIGSLLLSLLLVTTLLSCSSSLVQTETEERATDVEETVTALLKTTEEEKTPIVLPKGFSAGYARESVNPDFGTNLGGYHTERASEVNLDDITISCTALSDGEQVFLFLSFDVPSMGRDMYDSVTRRLEEGKIGIVIPKQNVVMNASHSHSAPAVHREDTIGIGRYLNRFYPALFRVAESAVRDLASAEIFTSTVETVGMNYVRRYVSREDGSFLGNWPKTMLDPAVACHESQPDEEMQILRFDREEKKDIVLCNWQCHPCSPGIGSESGRKVSADWVGSFRDAAEQELDIHFAYLQGAAGNLVSTTHIAGEKNNTQYKAKGVELAGFLKTALQSETKVEAGAFSSKRVEFAAKQNEKNLTTNLSLTALSIGKIAFATFPGELHDTLGMELKEKSPFAMTFVCGYSNGSNGYLPASFAFENGGYEVESTRFRQGEPERMVAEQLQLLKELNEK